MSHSAHFQGQIVDECSPGQAFRVACSLESSLFNHPQVEDCVVLTEEDASRIAYVVTHHSVDPDDLRAWLAREVPGESCDTLMRVSALPITPDGYLDEAKLRSIPLTDEKTCISFERRLANLDGVKDTLAIPEERREEPLASHFSDLLNDWHEHWQPVQPNAVVRENPVSDALSIAHGAPLDTQRLEPCLGKVLERTAQNYGEKELIYIQPDGSEVRGTYACLYGDARRVSRNDKVKVTHPDNGKVTHLVLGYCCALSGSTWHGALVYLSPVPKK